MMLKSRALLKNKMISGDVIDHLDQLNVDFEFHMQKEEKLLFPYIRKMEIMINTESAFEIPPFGSILKPAEVMINEHRSANENLKQIRNLCDDYKLNSDENDNKKTFFELLKEFERDFHLHIHLENNLLFPKAINLEKKLKKLYFKN